MGSPERPSWSPLRIVGWSVAALVVVPLLGPTLVANSRPADGHFFDFVQEYLSARCWAAGDPVYGPQVPALIKHTGYTPSPRTELLPRNAHPPGSVLLALPFGYLDYPDAHQLWNLLTLPLFLAALFFVVREAGLPWRAWSVLPAAVLLLLFHPLHIQLVQGQLNFVLAFLLVAGWAADRNDRPVLAGLAIGAAAGLKLFPGLLFVYLLAASRWRALIVGTLTAAAVNLIAWTVLGTDAIVMYAREVVPLLAERFTSSPHNVSLPGLFARLFDPAAEYKLIPLDASRKLAYVSGLACQLAVAGAVAWAAGRDRSPAGRDRAVALACVGMVLASPIAWTHYFLLWPVPLALLWMRLPSGWPRWLFWFVAPVLWVSPSLVLAAALGPGEAEALKFHEHRPIPVRASAGLMAVYTYAAVALFLLLAWLPTREPVAPAAVSVGGPAAGP